MFKSCVSNKRACIHKMLVGRVFKKGFLLNLKQDANYGSIMSVGVA